MDPPPAPAYADPPPAPAYADPPSPAPFSDEGYESSQPGGDDDEEEVSQETEDNEEDSADDGDEGGDDHTEEQDEASSQQQPRPSRTRPNRPPRDYRHLRLKSTPTLPLLTDPEIASTVREIGRTASWSLSTAKPGNGVDQLRDSSLDTYWQSDGLQPHYINIQFPRRQTVCAIALYMDFNLDESYTPKRMKVRVGTTFHNLEEVRTIDVREPCGWCTIPLWRKWGEDVLDNVLDPEGETAEDEIVDGRRTKVPLWKRKPMRTHLVQICILAMHQNGRDTHVRQVKIFGPRDYGNGGNVIVGQHGLYRGLSSSVMAEGDGKGSGGKKDNGAAMMMGGGKLSVPAFQTVGMSQFSVIR
mmetsp:Transcript_37659/g.80416  ORF Transcript_37659/g.80416 Transcript_37659/m.80416 type:complete len:357 (+) Transcript_37659:58-1128(+)|eukprot:CAMPEP_0172535026 /NCGR_PEP_ID=MMETSP1067-20121228/7202_1 /TAXON_ID=265564 ORGANISM="Thalassiosira punctigera, Strain Tpunct2005C2" /NCGR_SAMPLE_ID=MMETSP1067 /ASSEMBLY_ACC=CAM_ASM_000444 /LENGTH=356 /DNA_ID=CAMNT_0013319915 /DNA_START=38 /DNA_END=1111 /DNA_ORIENTATION=+